MLTPWSINRLLSSPLLTIPLTGGLSWASLGTNSDRPTTGARPTSSRESSPCGGSAVLSSNGPNNGEYMLRTLLLLVGFLLGLIARLLTFGSL